MARKPQVRDAPAREPERRRPDYGPQTWSAPPPALRRKLRERVSLDMSKPNLGYMNALLDAVEAGRLFGSRRPSDVEIAAALRATGRELSTRQPGEDREEEDS